MKKIPLTKGFMAIVDDDMFDYLTQWKWHVHSNGHGGIYAVREESIDKRKMICMHLVIIGAQVEERVDHIDGNGLNNQRYNLRFCTNAQNQCNRCLQSNNHSGWRGVSWDSRRRKWQVHITYARKHQSLGYFNDLIEAALAYDIAARSLHGRFARTNFLEV